MKRSEATQRIEQLRGSVSAAGNLYVDALEEISVFGSSAAGAPTPHDVDLLVTHTDPTGQIGRIQHGAERLEAALDDALYRESRRCYCVLNFNGRGPFAVIEMVGARHQTPNNRPRVARTAHSR